MDSIYLKGIELLTRIGVPDAERAAPQKLLVDVELFLSVKDAGESDDVTRSIDYKDVTDAVIALGMTERKTVERLAEDIAKMILKDFKPKGGVKVSVWKKPDLPLESACVTIIRP
jgi:dihydroneopterin aldolase